MIRVRIILETLSPCSNGLLSGEAVRDWGDVASALRDEAKRLTGQPWNYTLGFSGVEPTPSEKKKA